jgi:hypothetical protein
MVEVVSGGDRMNLFVRSFCTQCNASIRFASIEKHPVEYDMAVHHTTCPGCGHETKTLLSLERAKSKPAERAVEPSNLRAQGGL